MPKHTVHNPDYTKNKTADVVKKGSGPVISQEHWEINRDITPEGNDSGWGAFLPRRSNQRPQPHTKINDCDN